MSRLTVFACLAAILTAQQAKAESYLYRHENGGMAAPQSQGGSSSGSTPTPGSTAGGQGTPAPASQTITFTPQSATVDSGAAFTLTGQTTLKSPTWSVSGNPPWLVFNPSGSSYVFTGNAGSVTATTTYPVTVTATSNGTSVSETVNVTVQAASRDRGLPSNMTVRAGKPFSITLTDPIFATHTWNVSEYNGRLTSPQISSGVFTGTTAAPGSTYGDTYSITAFNERNDYYRAAMTVKPNVTFGQYNNTSGFNAILNQGVQGSFGPVSNAIGNLSYTMSGQLPAGLAFDPAKLTISGTPTEFGSYSVYLTATDSYDKTNGSLLVNVNVALPQDIVFPGRMSSSSYFVDLGRFAPGAMGTGYVTIRNATNNELSLANFTVSGDANDPEAFTIITSQASDGHGGQVFTTTHSWVPTNPNSQYSVSDYNHGQQNNAGSVIPCAQYLSPGYYCRLYIGTRSSVAGAKAGSFTVRTQNNTSTIPLKSLIQ